MVLPMIRLFFFFLFSDWKARLFVRISENDKLIKKLNVLTGQVGRVKGGCLPVEDVE